MRLYPVFVWNGMMASRIVLIIPYTRAFLRILEFLYSMSILVMYYKDRGTPSNIEDLYSIILYIYIFMYKYKVYNIYIEYSLPLEPYALRGGLRPIVSYDGERLF